MSKKSTNKEVKSFWIMIVSALLSIALSTFVAIVVHKVTDELILGAFVFALIMTIMTFVVGYGLKWYEKRR